MTKVIEIPGIVGDIVVYIETDHIVVSNGTDLNIKVDGNELKAHTNTNGGT